MLVLIPRPNLTIAPASAGSSSPGSSAGVSTGVSAGVSAGSSVLAQPANTDSASTDDKTNANIFFMFPLSLRVFYCCIDYIPILIHC